jgi:hypothetical protein
MRWLVLTMLFVLFLALAGLETAAVRLTAAAPPLTTETLFH